MDTEWKLKQLDELMRHETVMRELQGNRLDSHDRSIAAIREIMERTETNIEALSAAQLVTEQNIAALSKIQIETQQMLQLFIESLTRGNGNGKH